MDSSRLKAVPMTADGVHIDVEINLSDEDKQLIEDIRSLKWKGSSVIEKASKHDEGKAPIHLVDKEIIIELAKILEHGAEKYGAHNWRKGLPLSRYYSAAQRHLMAWNDGETNDADSGLNHLSHAACNLMFMIHFSKQEGNNLDDRPKLEKNASEKTLEEQVREQFNETIPRLNGESTITRGKKTIPKF